MLHTSNQTRITSVHLCLDSVLKLEPAFKKLLERKDQPDFPAGLKKAEAWTTLADLGSRTFWAQLEALCKLYPGCQLSQNNELMVS